MIYFDNAATTYRKPFSVIASVNQSFKKYGGNPGRSSHNLSMKSAEKIYETRETVSRFFHLNEPENVVFTLNATCALNMAIKSKIQDFCHVLISDIEHNSVYRPIEKYKSLGLIDYDIFPVNDHVKDEIESRLRANTKFIVTNLASNICGYQVPLSILSDIRKKYGIEVIADASQIAGHEDIDLSRTPVDALCAPGHKALFGMQGCGFVVYRHPNNLETLIEGGSGNESKNPKMPHNLPERMEGGTLPTPAIISLCAGIEHINRVGITNVQNKLRYLTDYFSERLIEIPKIKVLEPVGNGIVSFLYPPYQNETIASLLNDNGICVRAGFHCSPLAHQKLGTYNTGCIRVSFSYFNTAKEIDECIKILKEKSK